MKSERWDITELPSYKSRDVDNLNVLWSTDLPESRDAAPALWDTLMGFFQDSISNYCQRPGHLVVTPRELMRSFKRNEREPFCGNRVITELYRRGDIITAGNIDSASSADAAQGGTGAAVGASVFSSLRNYLWSSATAVSSSKPAPGPEDELMPLVTCEAISEKAAGLVGPFVTAEIHTLKSLANACTAGNERDAAAVAVYLVSQKKATILSIIGDNNAEVIGVRIGSGNASDADKSLLQTKAAKERLYELSNHLNSEIALEKKRAVEAAKAGDKATALTHVQRKTQCEKKLKGVRASLKKLGDVLMAVDDAENNRETVNALKTAMETLKTVTEDSDINADTVDDVSFQLSELMGKQEDLKLALDQMGQESLAEEAANEEELLKLLEEDTIDAIEDVKVPDTAPVVDASTAAQKHQEETSALDDELAKLLAESSIEDEKAASKVKKATSATALG